MIAALVHAELVTVGAVQRAEVAAITLAGRLFPLVLFTTWAISFIRAGLRR